MLHRPWTTVVPVTRASYPRDMREDGSPGFASARAGNDLSRQARDLARIHDAVLAGGAPPRRPRPLVARSWERVMALGLDPDRHHVRDPRDPADLARRRTASPLHLVVDDLRAVLGSTADAAVFVMVVCDADGTVLWREGSTGVRQQADRLGFAEGAVWTEEQVGTNAIGTALAEAAPVELFSAEHFEHQQHPWYCTAAPIHDPRTGRLLGVVDVSGPALTLHPAIGALLASAVRLAEHQLWRRHQEDLHRLRSSVEGSLGRGSGPLLVVDDDGWVAHHAGLAGRDRIAAPREHQPLSVPGLGLCLPERLRGGWLVRPRGQAARLVVDLVLDPGPVLHVRSEGNGPDDTETWTRPLTPRQAEVLGHLHAAGPAGLGARELSVALYGDAEHEVSARAEISRLRRAVGALVTSHPYRIADGVALSVPTA